MMRTKILLIGSIILLQNSFASEYKKETSLELNKINKKAEYLIIKGSPGEGVMYYKTSSAFKNPEGDYMLANFYKMGAGRPPYYHKGLINKLLERSCKNKYQEACEQLRTKSDLVFKLKYYFLRGDKTAQARLLQVYTNGYGLIKPSKEMVKKYQKIPISPKKKLTKVKAK